MCDMYTLYFFRFYSFRGIFTIKLSFLLADFFSYFDSISIFFVFSLLPCICSLACDIPVHAYINFEIT